VEIFHDLHSACKKVSCDALISPNLLRLKFQNNDITIADLYIGWRGLINNYEKMAAENVDSPKGNTARTISNSLIKRKPCVEPVLDGRLGGAYALQKLV